MIHEVPLFFLSLEPVPVIYLLQEIPYWSEDLIVDGKGGLLPAGLQGWPLKFVLHVANVTGVSPSPAGPPGGCPLHLLHLPNLSFVIEKPNRYCILELRANQSFVCNFYSLPRCQCQIGLIRKIATLKPN